MYRIKSETTKLKENKDKDHVYLTFPTHHAATSWPALNLVLRQRIGLFNTRCQRERRCLKSSIACLHDDNACAGICHFGHDPNTCILVQESDMFYGRILLPIPMPFSSLVLLSLPKESGQRNRLPSRKSLTNLHRGLLLELRFWAKMPLNRLCPIIGCC